LATTDAGAVLKREPLVDLALKIQLHGLADFDRRIDRTVARSAPGFTVPIARIRVVGIDGASA
jgi:hypothetical protein